MNERRIKTILTKDIFDIFKENNVPENMILNIEDKIAELGAYIPTVGIFGKTGAGKSSLCNALFGKDTAKVNDVHACTRAPQEIFVKISEAGSGINLIDLPGVGESQLRDTEYAELYDQWIPKLDLVVWVVKANDRTFSIDEHFYENVVKRAINTTNTPFLVVINQVDKINPIREWDNINRRPGHEQMKVIGQRTEWAASKFNIFSANVVAVSAFEKYNLGALVEAIIDIVPNEKKLGFLRQIRTEHVTEKSEQGVIKGIVEYIKSIYVEVKPYVPTIIRGIQFLFKLWRGGL
jgi:small GTP-binding protein